MKFFRRVVSSFLNDSCSSFFKSLWTSSDIQNFKNKKSGLTIANTLIKTVKQSNFLHNRFKSYSILEKTRKTIEKQINVFMKKLLNLTLFERLLCWKKQQ